MGTDNEWTISLLSGRIELHLSEVVMDGRNLDERTTIVRAALELPELMDLRDALNKAITALELQTQFPLRGGT